MCEMCSELIAFLLVFFVVTFEQISHTVLSFPTLTLSNYMQAGQH